jgi:hypothetical protein
MVGGVFVTYASVLKPKVWISLVSLGAVADVAMPDGRVDALAVVANASVGLGLCAG